MRAAFLLLACATGFAADAPRFVNGTVVATGELRVFVDQPAKTDAELWDTTPLAGTITRAGELSTFTPRFAFEPGLKYRALAKGEALQATAFTAPVAAPKEPTAIAAMYPTAKTLPENTLRMYLHFTAPMKQGVGSKYLTLTDGDGKTVEDPFLPIDQELWGDGGKRLTLLFDPARVKRGLKPREEAGPILREGGKYTLVVSAEWPDSTGAKLKAKHEYSFAVAAPDDEAIDPAKWTLRVPEAGKPLEIAFGKTLDKALAERLIWVVDTEGKKLALPVSANADQSGVTVGDAKTMWKPGKYKLLVDTRLEDVCGNRVGEPFEVDEFRPVTKVVEGTTVERAFTVK